MFKEKIGTVNMIIKFVPLKGKNKDRHSKNKLKIKEVIKITISKSPKEKLFNTRNLLWAKSLIANFGIPNLDITERIFDSE